MIRFRDCRVVSATYQGDPQAPIPFPRGDRPPVRLVYDAPNDGGQRSVTATLTNELLDPLPDCRAVFVVPQGEVHVQGGRLESVIDSDDGALRVVTIRCDLPAAGKVRVTVEGR